MKRLHVHIGVKDLDSTIAFYSGLFGQAPSVTKPDYAKWMLDDPRVNFAVSTQEDYGMGVRHLGVQVDSREELDEVYSRLEAAGGPVLDEGKTACCYAKSEKSWIADPDGILWEAFHTTGESTVYGSGPVLADLAAKGAEKAAKATACC
jgi:catechol 2,3-dioxygenase-like lactoylglutathione lyase family enzyme